MGLSGSKTTTGPSKQALPYLQQASGALQSAYTENQPRLNEISGSLFDAYKDYSANAGQDLTGARGYSSDVLGGKYLDQQNPYLQGMIDTTSENVSDRINALFSNAGQTGSSRQIGELGKQLAAAENNLRYQSYGDEMDRMAQAAQLGLGINQAANANAATQGALGATAAEVPYIGAEKLAQGLGGLWSNSQTTKQSQSLGSLLAQAAGTAAGAFAASDRRLKKDVVQVGTWGKLPAYLYNYITEEGGDPKHVGVMAQDVAEHYPEALGPKIMGEYLSVNYAKLAELV